MILVIKLYNSTMYGMGGTDFIFLLHTTPIIGIIPGNKSDKTAQREIPLHVGDAFASRHNMKFIEASAKEADNVDKVFLEIAHELTRLARLNDLKPAPSSTQELASSSAVGSWGCCTLL